MCQFFSNASISIFSRFLVFGAVLLALFAVSRPVLAQEKADLASSSCIPSDLAALIVSEGRMVRVSEVREGSGGKQHDPHGAALSSPAFISSDDREKKEAYKVLLKEAREDNAAAMVNLGVFSLAGWGTQPNAGAALYWLHSAADRGYEPALYDLGILYFKGCGVPKDAGEAFHFFDLSARDGYAPAEVNLGYFYNNGFGVTRDDVTAALWYRKAAESGEAQAQYNLADLYLHGEGVPKDESKAFVWFQKAAIKGHTGGQIMTGSMLATGRGTSRDLAGAYFWIFTAVLQGDDRGAATLRGLERQLSGAEIAQVKARARLQLAGVEAAKN